MEDINRKILQIGDKVIFTYYGCSTMYKGKISRITERRAYIIPEWSAFPFYINKDNVSTRIIKI